jgi:shikimate 5-dehydrogenase
VRELVARYQDGIPMLVHQAARAVALALGSLPPADPLLRAARS